MKIVRKVYVKLKLLYCTSKTDYTWYSDPRLDISRSHPGKEGEETSIYKGKKPKNRMWYPSAQYFCTFITHGFIFDLICSLQLASRYFSLFMPPVSNLFRILRFLQTLLLTSLFYLHVALCLAGCFFHPHLSLASSKNVRFKTFHYHTDSSASQLSFNSLI